MKTPRRRRDDAHTLCASRGEGDGIDPREDAHDHATPSTDRKTLQLCKQVRLAVESALSLCADEHLQSLRVHDAEPAPNAGCIRIWLIAPPHADVSTTAAALARARGLLRGKVARVITRKKVPTLTYELMPEDLQETSS